MILRYVPCQRSNVRHAAHRNRQDELPQHSCQPGPPGSFDPRKRPQEVHHAPVTLRAERAGLGFVLHSEDRDALGSCMEDFKG